MATVESARGLDPADIDPPEVTVTEVLTSFTEHRAVGRQSLRPLTDPTSAHDSRACMRFSRPTETWQEVVRESTDLDRVADRRVNPPRTGSRRTRPAVDPDPLPVSDQPGGVFHAHDGGQAVLPRDHRAMGHLPPTSVTRPRIATNTGVQLGSVYAVTRISPVSRSASAMSRITRARPSTVPADTGRPTSAPAGTASRRYVPATASPSDVSTRGGVSAWYAMNASLRWPTSWSSDCWVRTTSPSSSSVR